MTRGRRFHVPDLESGTVALPPEEAHHLLHVLRLREGARVSLFDGRGRAVKAEIAAIRNGVVTARVLEAEPSSESPLSLSMVVAPPRGDRMVVLIEKLTELGVTRIVPLASDRGRKEGSLGRWRRIAVEACKQCGRNRVPEIVEPRDLEAALGEGRELKLAAHPGAPPLARVESSEVTVAIGPEGGWSDRELEILASAGATLFGMGPRTLRTETAAISAAALLQYLTGDLSAGE